MAKSDPFGSVRTGWNEVDFDTRTSECLCASLEFKPDDVVLDYGCGPGYSCRMIAPQVRQYIGLDVSEEMLTLARRRNVIFANVMFVKSDGVSIPFPNDSFDCLCCDLVLQHVTRATTREIIAEMKRVMKPDARFAIQVPGMGLGKEVGFTPAELEASYPEWDISPTEFYVYLKPDSRG